MLVPKVLLDLLPEAALKVMLDLLLDVVLAVAFLLLKIAVFLEVFYFSGVPIGASLVAYLMPTYRI